MSPIAQVLYALGPGNSTGLLGTSQSLFSWTYMVQASCNCFRLLRQTTACALALARARAGKSKAARIARMAMTTKSSIRVKPQVGLQRRPVTAAFPHGAGRAALHSVMVFIVIFTRKIAQFGPERSGRFEAQWGSRGIWGRASRKNSLDASVPWLNPGIWDRESSRWPC